MLKMHLVFFIHLIFPSLAFAQTAVELDALLETNAVTTSVAARFVMGAAGLTTPELSGAVANNAAYQAALSKGWVKKAPEEAISVQETAFLMMNVLSLREGSCTEFFTTRVTRTVK
jgi:hypothetical protein